MRSQIEWGVPLRKTFSNLSKEIRSWFVIVNFAMMIETIEIGGNSFSRLEILSEYSEKERELQINRRAMLKPYIVLAFIWSVLIAVTTTIVALTTYMMTTVVSTSLSTVALHGDAEPNENVLGGHNSSMLDFRVLHRKDKRRQLRRWLSVFGNAGCNRLTCR